jgi:XRE family transcriptional regulator, regulator of sulfur utilization
MEDQTLLVGKNLRRLREEKHLSLEGLAELTGVSRSMLGQIERGVSSPTVATVWKIANGLKVSFTALLNAPQEQTALVRRGEITPLIADGGRYRLYPLFPIEEGRRFEVYSVEVDPGGALSSEPHPAGTQEFLTVFAGELTVSLQGEQVRVTEGDSVRFRADREHGYRNAGNTLARLSLVIQYAP